MKKILLSIVCALGLLTSKSMAQVQTFSVADTVWATVSNGSSIVVEDAITNITDDTNLNIKWIAAASNFPSDWSAAGALNICDDVTCHTNSGGAIWNGTIGTAFTATYPGSTSRDTLEDYHMLLDFSDVTSTGTYYFTVRMTDITYASSGGYSKTTTFVISRWPTAVPTINNTESDIVLYPNPTTSNEINLLYSPSADIKNISVYNIIGKVMGVYKVTNNNSANLNLENIPSGIYFVRLFNSNGDVVATRKFTKQ